MKLINDFVRSTLRLNSQLNIAVINYGYKRDKENLISYSTYLMQQLSKFVRLYNVKFPDDDEIRIKEDIITSFINPEFAVKAYIEKLGDMYDYMEDLPDLSLIIQEISLQSLEFLYELSND